jgi:N-acyl-D-amino-acid deacylase
MWALLLSLPAQAPAYDVVIRHGRVVDGAGTAAFHADVAIRDGRIVAVGRVQGEATRELDARGCVVAPGFIDVHTHGESILRIPEAANFTRQGVTTIVAGNCGGSEPSIGGFLADAERIGVAPNIGSLVGHGTVRSAAMGGNHNRPPTPDELAAMERLVEQAMHEGALGLSTGLIYQPGSFAQTPEIVALARVAAAHDGIYASHMRSEGDRIADALSEVFTIAREARIRCEVSHIKLSGNNNWGRSAEVIGLIEKARAEGLDITQDQYDYTASSTSLSQLVPAWAREGGTDAYATRLADPAQKSRMAAEMKEAVARRGKASYDWVTVASCPSDRALNGKRVPDAATARRGASSLDDQIELILELQRTNDTAGIFHGIGEDDLRAFMRHPNTMFGSDSGVREFGKDVPHPRGYGNHSRVLGRYVRELGVLTLEEAVRKMTLLPATVFRIADRGMIRPGAWADIAVFDPAIVADRATFENPHQYAVGMRWVLVNGITVVENDACTGGRPGRAIRGDGFRASLPIHRLPNLLGNDS